MVFIVLIAVLGIVGGFFFFRARPEPEQVFRANPFEAQKVITFPAVEKGQILSVHLAL